MHILFTMSGWTDEGGGTMLPRQIARGLVRKGHRVSVVHIEDQAKPQGPPYQIVRNREAGVELFGIHNSQGFQYSLEHPEGDLDDPSVRQIMSGLLTALKPDVVHFHTLANLSLGAIEEAKRLGIPSTYTSHNYWPLCPRMYLFRKDLTLCSGPSNDGGKCAECLGLHDRKPVFASRIQRARQIFNSSLDSHLAVSERARQIFVQNGFAPERIAVLYPQSETIDAIWQSLGSVRKPKASFEAPLKVGYFGNLLAWKGVHVLVKALQAFQPGEVEGHVFGSGPDSYENVLRQLDEKRLMRFHGRYRPLDLCRLPSLVDVAVVPSVCEETGGLVVLEALAARIPVVGSRIGAIPEFIAEGVNGFLFEAGESGDLAKVLQKVISELSLQEIQNNISQPRGFGSYLNDLLSHYGRISGRHHSGLRIAQIGKSAQAKGLQDLFPNLAGKTPHVSELPEVCTRRAETEP